MTPELHLLDTDGIALLAFVISHIKPIALYPILGFGVVAICVGVGLLVGANILAAAQERSRKSLP